MNQEFDFTNLTEKDIFEILLKGIVPDFGYISIKKRIPFLQSLIDHGFIKKTTNTPTDFYYGQWIPLMNFSFTHLVEYSLKQIYVYKGVPVYTNRSKQLMTYYG